LQKKNSGRTDIPLGKVTVEGTTGMKIIFSSGDDHDNEQKTIAPKGREQ